MSELASLLSQLDDLWRELDCVNVDRLAPGLEPDLVRRTLHANGLASPEELVEWFAWHDGSVDDGVGSEIARPGGGPLLSLEQSLTARKENLRTAEWGAGEIDDVLGEGVTSGVLWETNWLPLTGDHPLTVELVDSRDRAVVVRRFFWDDPEASRKIRASSLAEVVSAWLQILRDYWRFDPEKERWRLASGEIPLSLKRTALL